MSQRLGMADGRCFTIHTADLLLNDFVMQSNGIQYQNNYAYRQLLQRRGPQVVRTIENIQAKTDKKAMEGKPNNFINQCQSCNLPLLKVPNTY